MDELTEKVVEELVKKLPVERVYDDIVSEPAKQIGHALTDLSKTVLLALAPFQIAAAYQDRLRNFIDQSVRRVPEESRIPPAPQIIGPVIEGIRYEPQGSTIEEMFSELLSRAMDRERVFEAHPMYPAIIRQLSEDEARILAALRGGPLYGHYRNYWPTETGVVDQRIVDSDDLERIDIYFRENVDLYFQHFEILGIAGSHRESPTEEFAETKDGNVVRRGSRHRRVYRLTPFGERFVKACVS